MPLPWILVFFPWVGALLLAALPPQGRIAPMANIAVSAVSLLIALNLLGHAHGEQGWTRIDALNLPLVLVSAGVGVTPMVSVLNALVAQRSTRPVVFVHAARSGRHHALRADLAAARQALPGLRTWICYEHPQDEDQLGTEFDRVGRLDLRVALARLLPDGLSEADVQLCGPQAFMRAQWQALLGLQVPAERIHREVFGPELLDHLL